MMYTCSTVCTMIVVLISQYKDFTTDPVNFPTSAMKTFINKIHNKGQRYGEPFPMHAPHPLTFQKEGSRVGFPQSWFLPYQIEPKQYMYVPCMYHACTMHAAFSILLYPVTPLSILAACMNGTWYHPTPHPVYSVYIASVMHRQCVLHNI